MTPQKTPFIMAVVVAIFGLIWAQIAAPTQLKPLTNHLLDYPHAVPALTFEKGIYRANVSHARPVATMPAKLKAWLNSYLPKPLEIMCTTNDERGFCGGVNERQAKYGGYAGGGTGANSNAFKGSDAEKAGQIAAIIASNKGATIEVIKNAIKAAGLEVPTVIPTDIPAPPPPTPTQPTTAPAQSAAYIAQYGTEVGRYGYVYADGSIAGTTKVADGTLRVLALGDTQSAAARNAQVVASQITAMSDQEILKEVNSTCTTNCQEAVTSAVTTILSSSAVLDTAVKEEIIAIQQQNSLAQEAYQAKIQAFLDPTADLKALAGCDPVHPGECRDLTAESYLRGLVTDSSTIHDLLSTRDTNISNYKKDIELVKIFADPSKSTTDIAKDICGDDRDCKMNFVREDYLNKLNYKDLAETAKKQLATNQMIVKFQTTSNEDLVKEYCHGSADSCDRLINEGGLLKSAGVDESTATALTKQKQAQTFVAIIESNQLGTITGKTVDYQAIYSKAFQECQSGYRGGNQSGCQEYAQNAVDQKTTTSTPLDYQALYKSNLAQCQSRNSDQTLCVKTATQLTDEAMAKSQYGAIYVPTIENINIVSGCLALGGTNCSSRTSSLDSIGALSGNLELDAAKIEANKARVYANTLSHNRIAYTLQNMDPANYDRLAADPNTDWVAQEAALKGLRQDGLTNAVIGWNDFTAGRFKRGNDTLLAAASGNGMFRTLVATGLSNSTFGLVSADTFGSLMGLENHIDKWGVISGGIIQGGDAAAVITAGVAIPAAPLLGLGGSAILGTGLGIATSTQMIGSATDTCTQAPGSEACHTAIAIAGISVVGTGLGVLQGAGALVGSGAKVGSLTESVGVIANRSTTAITAATIGSEAVGAVTFGRMAYEACGATATSLDCSSAILMAAASFGKLASTNLGLVAKLAQIEGKLGTVGALGSSGLQLTHSLSSGVFALSACSKIFEGPANVDETAMCAMGISGAVQDPLLAKLVTTPKVAAPTLIEIKSPEQIRLENARNELNTVKTLIAEKGISPALVKRQQQAEQIINSVNEAKIATVTKTLQEDLLSIKDINVKPETRADGTHEIPSPLVLAPEVRGSIERLNRLLSAVEASRGFPLDSYQATIFLTPAEIATSVKAMGPGSGKSSVITPIELAKAKKSAYLGANPTDVLEIINQQFLGSEKQRQFAKEQLGELYYVAEDGKIYRVDPSEKSFDPSTICTAQAPSLIAKAYACTVSGSKAITPEEFKNRLSDESANITLFSSRAGLDFNHLQGNSWGTPLTKGEYGSFHFVIDEGAKDLLNRLSVSKDKPVLIASEDRIKFEEVATTKTTLDLIEAKKASFSDPSKNPVIKNGENFIPASTEAYTKSLYEIAAKTVEKYDTPKRSLLDRLTNRKPVANSELATIKELRNNLRDATTTETQNVANNKLLEYLTSNKESIDPAIRDLSSRRSILSDIWDQLGMSKNDFGLSADGTTLNLRTAKGDNGQQYSTPGKQLALYTIGRDMLLAEGVITKSELHLPSIRELTVTANGNTNTISAWYGELRRGGNTLVFLDGTPESLYHLGLGGMQGRPERPPTEFMKSIDSYTDSNLIDIISKNIQADKGKLPAVVLGDPRIDFDRSTAELRTKNKHVEEVYIAQYQSNGEEFFIQKKVGNKWESKPSTKSEWDTAIHNRASSTNPESGMVVVQGRDSALDLTVKLDSLNIRFHDNAPRESIGTRSIQDSTTQGIYRERLLVERTSESMISDYMKEHNVSRGEAGTESRPFVQFH